MSYVFRDAALFNSDVSGWDVSSVTIMLSMFQNATAFNNGGVALNWANTGLVNNMNTVYVPMEYTGYTCRSPIETWESNQGTPLEKALLFVSGALNKGIKPVENIAKFEDGMEQLSKVGSLSTGMEEVEKISKFYDTQQKIINN